LQLKIFFKAFPETAKCPGCGKVGFVRRSRARNFYEAALKFTRIFGIFKCRECGWRGLKCKYTLNRYSFITFVFYSALIIGVAYIIIKVLKKNFGGELTN